MVNINLRVDTAPNNGQAIHADSENFAKSRKPLEENLASAGAALPEPGTEIISLQRLAVCRLNNSGGSGGNLGGPQSPPPVEEKRVRREIANSNERRRMQSINAGFQSLRALLPRRDGEKISKASILQQTADMLKTLQAEKHLLSQQNLQYKQRLENVGEVPVNPTNLRVPATIPEEKPPMRHAGIIAPPKKRRKFENAASGDSSDEGVGMLSDADMVKDTPPAATVMPACPQAPTAATAQIPGGQQAEKTPPAWEMELLQNELIKLRLALDQERRMRLLLEDQLRAVELSRLQTLSRLPAVPSLMEYNALPSVSASPSILNSAPIPIPPRPSTAVYSNAPTSTTMTALKHPDLQQQLPLSTQVASNSRGSGIGSYAGVKIPAASHPLVFQGQTGAGAVATGQNPASSKHHLNAIVEAIKHLEGDHLFVDVECTEESRVGSNQGLAGLPGDPDVGSRRVFAGLEAMRLDAVGSDSGISSPVSDRYGQLNLGTELGGSSGSRPGLIGSQQFPL